MNTQTLECSFPLPPDLECERCLHRLQFELSRIQGVISTAINQASATLLIAYEPGLHTPSSLERRARQIGANIAARTEHQIIRLGDLHCPDCAATIQKDTRRLPGVLWAEVRFASAQMVVEYDTDRTSFEAICHVINDHGIRACPLRQPTTRAERENSEQPSLCRNLLTTHRKATETAVAALLTVLAALPGLISNRGLDVGLYAAAILLAGRSIAQTAWHGVRARAIDMNVLVVVAVLGAVGLGEWFEGATVIVLFNVGNLLQIGAMERTRRSIRALMELGPRTARVLRAGQEAQIPVEQIALQEVVLVKPGERIPMDGVVVTGTSTVNQSPITGESLPVRKQPGDQVFGGTLNGPGAFEFQVTHLFQDTMLARIIHWVEEAQAQRAPAQQFIDRFARVYTPLVVGLALCVAFVPPIAIQLSSASTPVSSTPVAAVLALWFSRALAMLLIACPCALVISTPVAIVTAIGSASRKGALIKGGAYLEALGNLRVLLYDKTGTLTLGQCRIEDVIPLEDANVEQIMEIALALEAKSEHPLAAAFTHAAHQFASNRKLDVEDFRAIPGGGVCGRIDGEMYLLGNAGWLRQHTVEMDAAQFALDKAEATGKTTVVLSTFDKPIGLIVIGDTPRLDALPILRDLEHLGVRRQAMLTGDNVQAAQAVASAVGIQDVRARLLPNDKLALVKTFRQQYGPVGMVGDGVNDAPALAAADIGIVMGATGSDTAMETADIALMADDLSLLPYLIRLSRRTRAIVFQNVVFALLTKGLLLVTALVAGVPLWLAVLGDVGVSLVVTLNALRLLDGGR